MPLCFVVVCSMIKDFWEDSLKAKRDREENEKIVEVNGKPQ